MNETIFNYVLWRSDIQVKNIPYNDVDYLILTILSYLEFEKMKDEINKCLSIEKAFSIYHHLDHEFDEAYEIFKLISSSLRYKDIKMIYFADEKDEKNCKQFAAITFLLENHVLFIAYRGTDDTFIGWQENTFMLYDEKIPSQLSSLQYLKHIEKYKEKYTLKKLPIILSGHSKGGHLAMYASIFAPKKIQNRIIRVINYDGPGVFPYMMNSLHYKCILPRIISYIPQYAFFGLLFYHEEKYAVIHSFEKGLNQHDPFSWKVKYNDFIYDELLEECANFQIKMNTFLNNITNEEKKLLFDTLFTLFHQLKISSFNDLYHLSYKHIVLGIKEMSLLNSHIRKLLIEFLHLLYFEVKK